MRRLAGIATLLSALAAGVLLLGSVAQGNASYTFHAIFDDARGLIPGQLVKIAGAKAGEISAVTVTPQNKAEVTATIPGDFVFHQDATCSIRPDGLIGENYLDCDPGTSSSPLLRDHTVPVSQTTEPVSLLDLFNIFNVPARERFQVLIDELGIATAGEGDNINAILQRANPTLGLARRVIAILDHQTAEIATAIDATGTIAADGAANTPALRSFLSQAASLSQLTANHSSNLSRAIANLPGFLDAAQPALSRLDTVARDGTPLLSDLRTAIPDLNRVDTDIRPFTRVATPALAALSQTFARTIPTVKLVTPLVREINRYLKASGPTTASFAKLVVNLLQHGFAENFLQVVYYVAGALAHEDATAHQLSALLMFPNNGSCANYATTVVAGCQSHYGSQPAFTPARRGHRRSAARRAAAPRAGALSTAPATGSAGTGVGTATGGGLASLPSQLASGINQVIGTVSGTVRGLTGATGGGAGGPAAQSGPGGLQHLLNFLLH
jgi:virulence factor Mce-like protein